MDKKFGDKQQNHKGYNPKADMKFFEPVAFLLMFMAHHNVTSLADFCSRFYKYPYP
ncbi:hypothetical protein LDG_7795 [Legionella drancourtii LLAP12]|uniref:Uncharacterized protein n=1 Tax=Legionella drancourtii LLAP12 TaxID=658187 RepID=G9ER84_9GAMM|nr:hypothetical protein LDG_7795 [Legionella drancourtii LLAP12]